MNDLNICILFFKPEDCPFPPFPAGCVFADYDGIKFRRSWTALADGENVQRKAVGNAVQLLLRDIKEGRGHE